MSVTIMQPLNHPMFGLRAAVVCTALLINAPAIFAHSAGHEHGGAPAQHDGAAPAQHHGAAPAQHHGAAPAQHHGAAPAQHHGAPAQHHGAAANREAVDVTLHDLELLNQDNERVKLASDVLGDKLVAVNFFYSSCTTTCPITNAIFMQLQSRLGDRLDRDVQLVSLTVDPVTDTPRRLESFAAKFHRKPGWTWLTGAKQNVDRVLEGLGAYSADYTLHPVMVVVGDPRSGRWSRLFGFPAPEAIVAKLDELEAARTHGSLSTEKEQ